jgi:hypothetical protein
MLVLVKKNNTAVFYNIPWRNLRLSALPRTVFIYGRVEGYFILSQLSRVPNLS